MTQHSEIPRPEYPRPQFTREKWLCLNGEWEFETDAGDSGLERGLLQCTLAERITVPFCPESVLSGIGRTDHHNVVWYRKRVELPATWGDVQVLLHFGAVDYDATVWAETASAGKAVELGRHRGGFTPFTVSLAGVAAPGDAVTIVVRARDPHHVPQARGKQADAYAPHGCHYTRTTGIWQTVWLEPVPAVSMKRPRITPHLGSGSFAVEVPLSGNPRGWQLRVRLGDLERPLAVATTRVDLDFAARVTVTIPADTVRPWSIQDPHLYPLTLELLDAAGKTVDRACTYAGLRSVAIEGKQVKLNGVPVFQRLVLDQGYYPDGVMTAPTDDALIRDITLAQEAGFNGARLHQKVFEERFLYHADRLGYLVWGEFGDWGCGGYGPAGNHQQPGGTYITQWLEALERDYSHPSIVGWCPLNETHQDIRDGLTQLDDVTRGMFLATKAMDTSRPVLDTSGYSHRVAEADIYDSHDYIGEQDFEEGLANMVERHMGMPEGRVFTNSEPKLSLPYRGQPYFVSEFGGFKWIIPAERPEGADPTWGYGSTPRTEDEFYQRFQAVCRVLLENPLMFGYCYTQLTDITPELNGIYTFDRRSKFDNSRLHAIQTQVAAIEAEWEDDGVNEGERVPLLLAEDILAGAIREADLHEEPIIGSAANQAN